jgi:hypothetical protein
MFNGLICGTEKRFAVDWLRSRGGYTLVLSLLSVAYNVMLTNPNDRHDTSLDR